MANSPEISAPLSVDAREACRLLSISDRSLYAITSPRGPLKVAKLGTKRLYRVVDLEQWLADQAQASPEAAT